MNRNLGRVIAALVLTIALISAIAASVGAVGEGVKSVAVTGNATEILSGQTINLTATVLANQTDSWVGNITVTGPGPITDLIAINGDGMATDSEAYPGAFGGTASTSATGTYTVSVTAQVAGGPALVSADFTFEVKDYVLLATPSRITPDSTTTITVGGSPAVTVWVAHPRGGNTTASAAGDGEVIYPTDFGGANSTEAGVYLMGIVGEDQGVFDVQRSMPHQGNLGFSTTTDACAACHRVHTASGAKLLKVSSQYGLCTSCHEGSGANTAVTAGKYLGATEGTQNAGLRGGGFEQAIMDTDVDGDTETKNITSKHSIGEANPTVWGSGGFSEGSDTGETISALECGSCHNPHGNANYRILRGTPLGLDADAPDSNVNVPDDEATKTYTISYDSRDYRDLAKYGTTTLASVTDWCTQCHSRYDAAASSGHTDAGDDNFRYRHMTEGLAGECFRCHVAHGTSSSMSAYATDPEWPGGDAAGWQDDAALGGNDGDTETEYSRLLHVDNSGVCVQCHNTAELIAN